MGNALLPFLCYHTRGFFARDGVYRDPTSRFPYLSLCFTEPVLHATIVYLASIALFLLHPLLFGTAPPFSRSSSAAPRFLLDALAVLPECTGTFALTAVAFFAYLPAYLLAAYAPLQILFASASKLLLPPRLQLCPCLAGFTHAVFFALLLFVWFRLLRRLAAGFRLPAKPPSSAGFCRFLCPTALKTCLLCPFLSSTAVVPSPPGPSAPGGAAPRTFSSFRKFAASFSTRAVVASAFPPLPKSHPRQPFLPLAGRQVVVTGGGSGIGSETARRLALWGAHVLIGCRNVDDGKRLAERVQAEVAALQVSWTMSEHPGKISVAFLDLCAFPSVRSFAAFALHTFQNSIDILVNNAGVMMISELTVVDECGGFEKQFVTNHLGHFLLTLLLLPAIKRAAQADSPQASTASVFAPRRLGRIINVASCAHVWHAKNFRALDASCTPDGASVAADALGKPLEALQGCPPVSPLSYDKRKAYGNSKLANIWFTKELQRRLIAERGEAATQPEEEKEEKGEEGSGDGSEKRAEKAGEESASCCVASSRNAKTGDSAVCRSEPLPEGTVGVYAVHPGSVSTKLTRHMVQDRPFHRFFVESFLAQTVMKTATDGAATQLLLCLADDSVLLPGAFYADGGPSWVHPAANDEERMKELWAVSEVICFGGIGQQTYVK
ncbi:hypothetical protein NCLIV_053680 [Neospora caninum Liverpool]|uniref:Retinol dehydrogenase 14 n=1 Tax=Neospora caninum (strain Liverpool) TaxID=572307 RepID=F0VMJ5_NEOCL|nr:hypothetical protein NCLIV_053680 [Neospora caninum Liverpool]CBZ54941.1 hypothetical protein NCLIV_053680 [Neospora caninum Liverpool]CEL69663.1 TPA: Retinol dehydrogenase 14 [Neospora caninum Liverpool]|eukprot:XP_003884969.1 hypothetical protein NCLIV_053680 [Neospora caninum Liverpool]